jgi:FkbM family methyltransferase
VGANVGVATFAAARRVGPSGSVLAIEADVNMCGLLQRSAMMGDGDEARVTILPIAVGDRVGLAEFAMSDHGTTTNALAGFGRFGGFLRRRQVVIVTLDWLSQHTRPPTLLKVDVEGAELLVLRGAGELIAAHRPTILCEVGEDVADEVGRFLVDRGYQLFDARVLRRERVPLTRCPGELLALHSERPVTGGEQEARAAAV